MRKAKFQFLFKKVFVSNTFRKISGFGEKTFTESGSASGIFGCRFKTINSMICQNMILKPVIVEGKNSGEKKPLTFQVC